MPKILIIEDDVDLAQKVRDWLEFEHNTVDVAHNGKDGMQMIESYQFELLILDWELPDMTGLDICRNFRARGGAAPILFLTGKGSVENKELGLDAGADDYLTKPFHVKELSARIRALMRRQAPPRPATLKLGNIEVDPNGHKVSMDGVPLQLLPREFALLEYLMRSPGQIFSSKTLLNAVWPSDSETTEDSVRTYIKTLRKKITPPGGTCPIQTIHGVGYKIE
jgi:two-component system OmpR family response regulator